MESIYLVGWAVRGRNAVVGSGRRRRCAQPASALPTWRIITTADIFDALTAERPYRAAMPVAKALAIMAERVGAAIDPDCFAALQRVLLRLDATLAA